MEKLTDLKTFEDACKIVGLDAEQVNKLIAEWMKMILVIPNLTDVSVEAYVRITVIVRAANQIANDGKPWFPNWKDSNEPKYYPWFDLSGPSGFRFVVCDYWFSSSHVGSRLCLKNYETAEYIGKQFEDLYRQFFVIEDVPVKKFEDRMKDLKVRMYRELLAKKKEDLTEDEVDFLFLLAKDRGIQEVLGS